MRLAQIGRAMLALALGFALSLGALRFITDAPQAPPAPVTSRDHLQPVLTLVRQSSTGHLLSVAIDPFEVGSNRFRIAKLSQRTGDPLDLSSAELRASSLESSEPVIEASVLVSQASGTGSVLLPFPGWWEIEIKVDGEAAASFYVKLDSPSGAPEAFASPDYASDSEAERIFHDALDRYRGLAGVEYREELSTGGRGTRGLGVWFITNASADQSAYHARTEQMDGRGSELYRDPSQQCLRQLLEAWQCSDRSPSIGPLELSYLEQASAFKAGRQEDVDGEATQVIFFYNPSQSAWYAWWVGEETSYVRRQAMLATGHFMYSSYWGHDVPPAIEPGSLDLQRN